MAVIALHANTSFATVWVERHVGSLFTGCIVAWYLEKQPMRAALMGNLSLCK